LFIWKFERDTEWELGLGILFKRDKGGHMGAHKKKGRHQWPRGAEGTAFNGAGTPRGGRMEKRSDESTKGHAGEGVVVLRLRAKS